MSSDKCKLTLYLGFFNGENYIDSILDQVMSQENQNFKLLLVDNKSTDNTLIKAKSWKNIFGRRITIIENRINYGAYGSLFKNIEKIDTEWFGWIHQDDFYKSSHTSTILELIAKSNSKIVGVCTTMGSVSNEGKKLNSKPRATWFSSNLNQAGQFLQNLKTQAIPDPASAFRLETYKKIIIPVHSSSFPDTEHTLRLLGYGKFIVSQKETMLYRENQNSISHTINYSERELGAVVGLIRVFSSLEFKKILNTINQSRRAEFTNHLLKALKHRIPNSTHLQVVEIYVLEQIIEEWGRSNKKISGILFEKYSKFASSLTLSTINNLAKSNFKNYNLQLKSDIQKSKITFKIWNFYFNINLGSFKRFNKKFIKAIYLVIFLVKPNHRLKTKW